MKKADKDGHRIIAADNRLTFRRLFLLGASLFFLFGIPFSTPIVTAAPPGLKKATFIPQWVPQAQFAGYYVALEKGIYKEYGIDLEIITGGPGRPASDFLKDRKVDFATLWLSTAVAMRSQGVELINIAQTMQKSALMLVAKKKSGILKPADMNGKKVGLWGPIFQVQPKAFFKKFNLKVTLVRQSFSVNLFLRDGVDIASAMWYNEYHTILNCGLNPEEISTFFFHRYGLNFPEDGIYTLAATFHRDPDLCRAFVQASLAGWRYAFAHPEETLDIVMKNLKRAYVPATRVHQKWMLARMRDLMMPDAADIPMGRLSRDDYRRVAQGLKDNRLIHTIPDFDDFYRTCYEK